MAGDGNHVASWTLDYFVSMLDGHVYRHHDGEQLMLVYGKGAAWTFVSKDEQALMENIVRTLLEERWEKANGTT